MSETEFVRVLPKRWRPTPLWRKIFNVTFAAIVVAALASCTVLPFITWK